MLGKLFKYDFRAMSRVMRFVVLGILCLAVLLTMFAAIQPQQNYDYYETRTADQITRQVLTGLTVLSALGMGAGIAVIMVFIYVHYYRNLFSDEGYLTHTLPVKSWKILLSKLLSSVVWALIGYAAILAGLLIILLGVVPEAFPYIGETIDRIVEAGAVGTVLLTLFGGLVNLCCGLLQVFLAITIGCAIANKHRIWAAIGIYAAISVVSYILNVIVSAPSVFSWLMGSAIYYRGDSYSIVGSLNTVLILGVVKNAGIATGCFFWIKHLMKRRLNLQ